MTFADDTDMTDRATQAAAVTAFAPATVSNVACGFDVLGFPLAAEFRSMAAFLGAGGYHIVQPHLAGALRLALQQHRIDCVRHALPVHGLHGATERRGDLQ